MYHIYGQTLTESVIPMKRSKSKIALIIFYFVALAAALCGAALLFFAMEREFDPSIKHFSTDAKFAPAAFGVCAGGAALAIAAFCTATKRRVFNVRSKRYSFVGVFAAILAGLMCVLYFGLGVKNGLPEEKPGMLLAELTFTVLSAAYFFLRASGLFYKKPLAALSGLLPALMCAFILLNLYFDRSDPLNAPLKIYRAVMLVSFMLYFTAEAGIFILRPKMSRKYAFASIAAVTCGGMVALSSLAARIADVDTFGYDIIKTVFFAVLWLYVAVSCGEKLLLSREKDVEEALPDNESAENAAEDLKEEIADDAEQDVEKIAIDTEDALEEADAALEEAFGKAEEAVEEAAEEAAQEADDAAQDAVDALEKTLESAEEKAEDAAEAAEDAIGGADEAKKE